MGEWHHPDHYTAAARRYKEATREAAIAIFIEQALPSLVATARSHGYALAVHGSRRRDLDLIAVPWTEKARDADTLRAALAATTKDHTGWGHITDNGEWTEKPQGRRACTITASMDVNLDLSVMPLRPKEVADAPE